MPPQNLIIPISFRAAGAPCLSIIQAAWSVISRAADISAAESAIQFWTVCLRARGSPKASRWSDRSQRMSKARRA